MERTWLRVVLVRLMTRGWLPGVLGGNVYTNQEGKLTLKDPGDPGKPRDSSLHKGLLSRGCISLAQHVAAMLNCHQNVPSSWSPGWNPIYPSRARPVPSGSDCADLWPWCSGLWGSSNTYLQLPLSEAPSPPCIHLSLPHLTVFEPHPNTGNLSGCCKKPS